MKKHCLECGTYAAKPLFKVIHTEPYFCTQKCAARWALTVLDDGTNEMAQRWCKEHGWFPLLDHGGECADCKADAWRHDARSEE